MTDMLPGATAASELCCLCTTYDPAAHPKRAIVSQKFDGIRCLWIGGRLVSREGSRMECAEHGRPELAELERRFGGPMMFDMELCVGTSRNDAIAAFRSRRPAGRLHIFDAVPLDYWLNPKLKGPSLVDRLSRLGDITAFGLLGDEPLKVIDRVSWYFADVATAADIYAAMLHDGHEGIVIKDAASPYYRGRTKAWTKLTPEVERKRKLKEVA